MKNKFLFLIFNLCLTVVLFASSTCVANGTSNVADTEMSKQDFGSMRSLLMTPYVHSPAGKCILVESTTENEVSDVDYLILPIFKTSTFVYSRLFNPVKRSATNTSGLLERNITPALKVSRNILFHSLQIHF